MGVYPLMNSGLIDSEVVESATFKTEQNGSVSFSLTKTGDAVTWDMGDGTIFYSTNSVSHTYADATEKTVTIYADDLDLITEFGSLDSKNITEINFEDLNGLGGTFNANNNANLTTANMPTNSSNPFTDFRIETCDLTGNLDVSGCIIQGIFRVRINPNLTSITHSTDSSQYTTLYFVSQNDITGAHNLSNIECYSTFNVSLNPNMTSISHKTTSNSTILYNAQGCDLTGTHDVSMLNLNNQILLYNNPNMTALTHGTNTGVVTSYQVYGCDLTGTHDVSMITFGSAALFLCYNHPNLTAITHDSAQQFYGYYVNGCNLSSGGTLDLSTIKIQGTGGGFKGFVGSTNNFIAITHEASALAIDNYVCINGACVTYDFTKFTNWATSGLLIDIQKNGMSAAEVNQVWVDLATVITSAGTGTIRTRASVSPTNAAADSSSGGNDGLAAISTLSGLGYTCIGT